MAVESADTTPVPNPEPDSPGFIEVGSDSDTPNNSQRTAINFDSSHQYLDPAVTIKDLILGQFREPQPSNGITKVGLPNIEAVFTLLSDLSSHLILFYQLFYISLFIAQLYSVMKLIYFT